MGVKIKATGELERNDSPGMLLVYTAAICLLKIYI